MSRPNKCIKDENGNDVWISRSNVVIPVVFKLDENTGEIYTLVEKRGPAVSHPGEWCCPCGYIDWDETLKEACHREVKEETGLDVSGKKGGYQFSYHRENKGQNYIVDIYRFDMDAGEEDLTLQKEETMGGKFASLEEIKEIAATGEFLHYDSIRKVFED